LVFLGATILIADALHTSIDLLTYFASLFGLKISQKRHDKKFPYGYYKAEINNFFNTLYRRLKTINSSITV
jgi:divalent metal cation (Fe/Co/Zn/Cd) transporter